MPSSAGLAAWLDSYQRALRDALDASARDGFRRVHANTVTGAIDPAGFSHTARRHLSRHLQGLGLTLDGLAADFDGLGLADPRLAEQRLDHLRATLELARELRTPLALVNIGGFGDPRSEPLAIELLEQTADLADRFGVRIAVRDPIGASAALAGQLGRLGAPQLAAAVDSLRAAGGADEAAPLLDHAGIVLLRDARRHGSRLEETAYGAGDVDFRGLLEGLRSREYSGPLVLRRDASGAAVDALRQGREYLEFLMAERAAR
jgi:sugar phosphate isomerase/epimerase